MPPRAPVGAAAFPDEGSEHPPAPIAPPPRAVSTGPKPRKGGGTSVVGKVLKGLVGVLLLIGVGRGAYHLFSYLIAMQYESQPSGPQTPSPAETPAGE